MTEETKEVEKLFPQGKEVTLKGKPFVIKPIGFGKLPAVLALFNRVKDVKMADDKLQIGAVGNFILENADVVVEISALATAQKKEFFDDVPLDEAIDLLQAIIEVNADFFITRLQPKLLTAMSKLSESVGALSSQSLSLRATA